MELTTATGLALATLFVLLLLARTEGARGSAISFRPHDQTASTLVAGRERCAPAPFDPTAPLAARQP
jgi:hypothetical protein